MPNGMRATIDWLVTILGAILVVLASQAVGGQPLPDSRRSSMEPTLDCAEPGTRLPRRRRASSTGSDRVLACRICYDLSSPKRGDIVVFDAPSSRRERSADEGGVYVKRLIGLPGDTVHEDDHGYIWINGTKLDEPYVQPTRREQDVQDNPRQRRQDLALCPRGGTSSWATTAEARATPGPGAPSRGPSPHREGDRDVLAAHHGSPSVDGTNPGHLPVDPNVTSRLRTLWLHSRTQA